jgi:CheY-like chemotaxis protein
MPSLYGKRVLMVDDSIDNQIIIRIYLSAAGAMVEVADNGHQAVELLQAHAFDAVLMDIQMPVMDGYQALAAARKIGYGGPIVALTAHAMKDERERCLAAGFNDYLSKPVDRHRLVKHLVSLLEI